MEKVVTEEDLLNFLREDMIERTLKDTYGPHPRIVKRKMNDGLSNKMIEVSMLETDPKPMVVYGGDGFWREAQTALEDKLKQEGR